MRTGLIIFFYFLFTVGCKSRNEVPQGIIPGNKMEMIMWDMIRADEFVIDMDFKRDSTTDKKTESIRLYEQVFRINNTNKEEFQKSLSFYTTHPALLKVMMDSLGTKQTDTTIQQKKPKRLIDSLRFRIQPVPKLP